MTTTSSRTPLFPRLRLSAHAKIIVQGRYLARNAAGTIIETPAQLFWRVATDIAQTKRLYPAALRIPVEACN
ncbi:MAG TPA: ribonucleotide reductase N-terminal alpha domain-containing protein [Nitrospiraceae bacterium]|nr:ribonucleotide reductase N-terminal alpha domain-containing protein [Nitrospiraceae bacterium]